MNRRPHWDDDLISAVIGATPPGTVTVTYDVYAVIAAVEDWQDANGFSRAGALARAEQAEAAIARVREVCDLWQRRYDSSIRHPADIPAVAIVAVLRALEGDSE